MHHPTLPVAVIGAGPVGLAAAAHLHERGLPFVVFELGDDVADSVRAWAHVRLFSPWAHDVDPAARRLLERHGWVAPPAGEHPTGGELVDRYLRPLAAVPAIADGIRTGRRVVGVTRAGTDKVTSPGRADTPFVVSTVGPDGPERTLVSAVIDASGTWRSPNPLGADGRPATGEEDAGSRIEAGIPDVLGAARDRYAGQRIAVVGSGHSAQNVVRDLAALAEAHPGTQVTWVVRRGETGRMFGGKADDQLPERGRLGADAEHLVRTGNVHLVTGFRTEQIAAAADSADKTAGVELRAADGRVLGPFDRIVTATGFRPDLSMLSELRVDVDPALESSRTLAPMIDPNVHSCGSVPPHGAAELGHPEPGLYVVGAKSYGRAPTFLLATGYEQVRSVVAEIAGDRAAAADVQLILPETGVCALDRAVPRGDAPDLLLTVPDASSACCG